MDIKSLGLISMRYGLKFEASLTTESSESKSKWSLTRKNESMLLLPGIRFVVEDQNLSESDK